MEFERTRRRMYEINLTPLIDVVFHLMVFVMLTTSFVVAESLELALPSGRASAMVAGKAMRIHLLPQGSVVVDDAPMGMDALNRQLVDRLGDAPDTRVALFTTPGVTVQQLVTVLDAVYLSGGRNVQVDKLLLPPTYQEVGSDGV